MKDNEKKDFRSGYVAIIGRPNVGKSTLLNSIIGEKVTIVTSKPQTTRNRITGIKTLSNAQIVFVDTPGIHKPKHKLGENMIKTAIRTLNNVDVILFMIEPYELKKEDYLILDILKKVKSPIFLLINKIDIIKKYEILPMINKFKDSELFKEIIPISALKRDGIDLLLKNICYYLPFGQKYYPDDYITDQYERFMVAEIVREKIISKTEEEVPHSVAVEIDQWNEREDGLVSISCNIYVEREGQKGIIIGKKGERLKMIGSLARNDIEKLLNRKVFLNLWIKVKKNWRNDKRLLKDLGYLC